MKESTGESVKIIDIEGAFQQPCGLRPSKKQFDVEGSYYFMSPEMAVWLHWFRNYYETSEDLCFRFVVVAVWKLAGSNGVQRIAFACSIADADTPAVKVQIVEPESAKSGKATQAKEIVRTLSTSNNLLDRSASLQQKWDLISLPLDFPNFASLPL
ncbi:hypothetical protein BV898_18542 [Hypsibius exemplaris]|uniref:Uncharacterized protein n=1 Tax=Hypsibius exemplaris TaxID=2072580 RepID=A0A9X6RN48_HYPEX|nr:hypothetical protein BV898_18542 [Hypsibius exemplaris]